MKAVVSSVQSAVRSLLKENWITVDNGAYRVCDYFLRSGCAVCIEILTTFVVKL